MALRLGLVGRGRWGRNIERTLSAFPDISVRVIGKGERPPHDLDGVLIATPSISHAEVALPYIANGIATFIEKPMTTSVADAERIREAADRSGALVFVGHVHLYNPAFQALMDALPALGRLRYAVHEGMNNNSRTDSSVLWDWLPHSLSMACSIFGTNPASVTAFRLSGSSAIESAVCTFLFDDIPLLSIVSWHSPIGRHRMTISGTTGTIVFDDKADQKLVLYDVKGEVVHPTYDDELPLSRELRQFLQMVPLGRSHHSHIELGVAVTHMIAAAEASIVNGGKLVNI